MGGLNPPDRLPPSRRVNSITFVIANAIAIVIVIVEAYYREKNYKVRSECWGEMT